MGAIDAAKRAAGFAALQYVTPEMVLGVGTGSTVGYFLEGLEEAPIRPHSAVATSTATETRLALLRIPIVPLGAAPLPLPLYVDGADEIDRQGRAIKGGGGAHWREKLVASSSQTWVCIIDESKLVEKLGQKAPVPLEVAYPDADSVSSDVRDFGGRPVVREGFETDAGNLIVDVYDLSLRNPAAMELDLETIPGVLACGIFARRRADIILVGHPDGSVYTLEPVKAARGA